MPRLPQQLRRRRNQRVLRSPPGARTRRRRALLNAKVSDAPPATSSTVLDMTLLANARRYNQRVAAQMNAAYDGRLFDCSAVMCRRLIESLIIDAYEHANRDGDI